MIGILSTAFLVLVNPAEQLRRSRDSDRKADLRVIQSSLELYRADKGDYPLEKASGNKTIKNCSESFSDDCPATVTYLQNVPIDPNSSVNGGEYYYCRTSNGCAAPSGGYALYSCVESTSDTVATSTKPSGFTCPGKVYLVTNP